MARIEGEITIARPIEVVFDYVADQSNEPQYNPNMVRAEKVTTGPIGAGTTFKSAVRSAGRTADTAIEVTRYDRPRLLASSTTMKQADIDYILRVPARVGGHPDAMVRTGTAEGRAPTAGTRRRLGGWPSGAADLAEHETTPRGGAVTRSAGATERPWLPLYRAGAVSAGVAVLPYVTAFVVVAVSEQPPESVGGGALFEYVDAHRSVYILRQVLWMGFLNLFLMVVLLALAVALRHQGPSLAAAAGMIGVSSWAVAFAWPTTGDGSLVMVVLSDRYADATTATERASAVAGAEVLSALDDVPAAIGVLQTLGVLLIGLLHAAGQVRERLGLAGYRDRNDRDRLGDPSAHPRLGVRRIRPPAVRLAGLGGRRTVAAREECPPRHGVTLDRSAA